ncbi:MAG TPA: hypothetical protein VFE77_18070 [Rhodanobacter sp.]|nr:hypothetical protein [Rhodanobacter sp.]
MNAQIANLKPLSPALQGPFAANLNRPARRHFVGDFLVRMEALAHFNALLARLQHFPLHRDQLATASRELAPPVNHPRPPAEIEQRLQRIDAVGRMIADASWQTADRLIAPARLVVDYQRSDRRLIPHGIPQVGRLDDAILMDAAWPQLADEVGAYLDFCRLRAIEARLSGCEVAGFAFDRADWQQARAAEAGLHARARRSATNSYLSAATQAGFRVY